MGGPKSFLDRKNERGNNVDPLKKPQDLGKGALQEKLLNN